jgi:hypothetical protein
MNHNSQYVDLDIPSAVNQIEETEESLFSDLSKTHHSTVVPPGFVVSRDPRYYYNAVDDVWYDINTDQFSIYKADQQLYQPVEYPLINSHAYYSSNYDNQPTWNAEEDNGPTILRLVVVESQILHVNNLVIIEEDGVSIGRDLSHEKTLRLKELEVSKVS